MAMAILKMAMSLLVVAAMSLLVVAASLGGKQQAAAAGAQVHHVVGGDRGWDPSSNVASWSSGRTFRVGDKIWFAYSAAESIVELMSKDEYESCDVSNPIRMYTDGLDSIPLDGEGTRYFVSSKPESCKKGLKLHVDVMPLGSPKVGVSDKSVSSTMAAAAAPTTPSPSGSGSLELYGSTMLFLVGLWLYYVAFTVSD